MKIILKSKYFFPIIKINANCKEEEKTGSGPGSCGGKSEKDLEKVRKSNLKQAKTDLKALRTVNQELRDQIDKIRKERHIDWQSKDPEHTALMKQLSDSVNEEYKLEEKVREYSYVQPKVEANYKPILEKSDNIIEGLPKDSRDALSLYIHGWGNDMKQTILAKNGGDIPTPEKLAGDLAESETALIAKIDGTDSPEYKQKYKEAYEKRLPDARSLVKGLNDLDLALNQSVLDSDVVVFTGISSRIYKQLESEIPNDRLPPTIKVEPGTEFQINSLISTSRDTTVAKGFAAKKHAESKEAANDKYSYGIAQPTVATYLEMHVKAGSKALALENYATEVSGKTAQWVVGSKGSAGTGNQQELLVNRKTKCIVRDVQEETFRGRPIRKIIVDASN